LGNQQCCAVHQKKKKDIISKKGPSFLKR